MASTNPRGFSTAKRRIFEVPLKNDLVFEVACDELPANPSELTKIFEEQEVPLQYYRKLAMEYCERDKISEGIDIVKASLDLARQSPNVKPGQKLPLLTMIATLYIKLKNWSEAMRYINEANQIDKHYEHTFAVIGDYHLQNGETEKALKMFKMALDKNNKCFPALIGLGKILYHKEDYLEALKVYRKALGHACRNTMAVEIRAGIAQCYVKLGMINEAKLALRRCIDLAKQPKSLVLILYAIIELNESKNTSLSRQGREAHLREGLRHIQLSHNADKTNATTLNLLANHYFIIEDLDNAKRCTQKALEYAFSNSIKAESFYQTARALHLEGQYDKAFEEYRKCLKMNPNHHQAQFGEGQLYIKRGDMINAEKAFEKIREAEPHCTEVQKILGSLYSSEEKKKGALEPFTRNAHDDPFVYIEIAQLHTEKDPQKALRYFGEALDLLQGNESEGTRYILLNNIAVMHHVLGNFEESEDYYSRAISDFGKESNQGIGDNASNEQTPDLKLTMLYNLGRLYEERFQYEKATAIYNKILQDYPSYIQAHLRLGDIRLSLGHTADAIECYKEALDVDRKYPATWLMMGSAQSTMNEPSSLSTSRRTFEEVLRNCDPSDIYAHVALGNLHSSTARELKSEKRRDDRKKSYKEATKFFLHALKRDSTNVYAANGLAIALAENDHTDEAIKLFSRVQEARDNNPYDSVNRAHIFVEQKKFDQAITMYEKASSKFFKSKDANILLCLARAQYIRAKAEKKHEIMQDSLKNTQKAYHIQPTDKSILYNIALIQQSFAQLISEKPKEERLYNDMIQAKNGLVSSQASFRTLVDVPQEEFVLYDRKITEQRIRYGETLSLQLERAIEEQTRYEVDVKQRHEEIQRKREEKQAVQNAERERKLREEEEKREKLEEARRLFMEKVQKDNEIMAERERDVEDAEPKKGRGRAPSSKKRNRADESRNDSDEPTNDDVEDPTSKRNRDRKQYRSKRIIEDSDEE